MKRGFNCTASERKALSGLEVLQVRLGVLEFAAQRPSITISQRPLGRVPKSLRNERQHPQKVPANVRIFRGALKGPQDQIDHCPGQSESYLQNRHGALEFLLQGISTCCIRYLISKRIDPSDIISIQLKSLSF